MSVLDAAGRWRLFCLVTAMPIGTGVTAIVLHELWPPYWWLAVVYPVAYAGLYVDWVMRRTLVGIALPVVLTLPAVHILRPLTLIDGVGLSIFAGWYAFVVYGPEIDSLDDSRQQLLALGVYVAPVIFIIIAAILEIRAS